MAKRKRYPPKSCSNSSQRQVNGSTFHGSHASVDNEPIGHPTGSTQPQPEIQASPSNHSTDQNLPSNQSEQRSTSETQDGAQNPPPTNDKTSTKYWIVDVIDEDGAVKKTKLKVHDVYVLPAGRKIILKWNKSHQPIGASGGLLGGFLGSVASNFANFPIGFEKWPLVPKPYKEHVWVNTIKQKFVVNDEDDKHYILKNLGTKWKDNRCNLYNTHHDGSLSLDANIELTPDGINRDQWALFLRYRAKPDTKRRCQQNRANRQKQTFTHTLGSKSLARKKDEEEDNQGRELSRGEMYLISHKRSDGSFLNEDARQKSLQLEAQVGGVSSEDSYANVFGKEHPGRVRGVGFGVCPSQLSKYSTSSGRSTMPSSSGGPSNDEWQRMKLELQESNSKVKFLEEQITYLYQLQGRQPPVFPTTTANQVADVGSPPVEVRRSSSASHNVEDQGGTISI